MYPCIFYCLCMKGFVNLLMVLFSSSCLRVHVLPFEFYEKDWRLTTGNCGKWLWGLLGKEICGRYLLELSENRDSVKTKRNRRESFQLTLVILPQRKIILPTFSFFSLSHRIHNLTDRTMNNILKCYVLYSYG